MPPHSSSRSLQRSNISAAWSNFFDLSEQVPAFTACLVEPPAEVAGGQEANKDASLWRVGGITVQGLPAAAGGGNALGVHNVEKVRGAWKDGELVNSMQRLAAEPRGEIDLYLSAGT